MWNLSQNEKSSLEYHDNAEVKSGESVFIRMQS